MSVIVRSEDVALAFVTRLQTIRTANGYETDIGRDVQQGRRKIPTDDEPPCIQLVEGNDERQDEVGRRSSQIKVAQIYVIDAFDQCDPMNPNTQAHKMIRDIKRAFFGPNAEPFRIRLFELNYLGKDIGPRPDGAGFVQARVMLEAVFAEDLAAP